MPGREGVPSMGGDAAGRFRSVLRRSAAVVPVLAVLSLAPSCSPETRYKTLSFFFDGVPPPGALPVAGEGAVSPQFIREVPGFTKLKMVFHEPFQKNECRKCHPEARGFFIGKKAKEICVGECHEDFLAEVESLPHVHGPVAVRDCAQCHEPHESAYPSLTLRPEPALCYFCHAGESLSAVPEHWELDIHPCTECHDPHAGLDPLFLRPREPAE